MFSAFFFQVSKTTHLPKVQQSGRHCMFTKIEGNAHTYLQKLKAMRIQKLKAMRVLFVAEQRV